MIKKEIELSFEGNTDCQADIDGNFTDDSSLILQLICGVHQPRGLVESLVYEMKP
jgi:hypothetical protein